MGHFEEQRENDRVLDKLASAKTRIRSMGWRPKKPNRAEIAAEVANYTDIAPIVQISEVIDG